MLFQMVTKNSCRKLQQNQISFRQEVDLGNQLKLGEIENVIRNVR